VKSFLALPHACAGAPLPCSQLNGTFAVMLIPGPVTISAYTCTSGVVFVMLATNVSAVHSVRVTYDGEPFGEAGSWRVVPDSLVPQASTLRCRSCEVMAGSPAVLALEGKDRFDNLMDCRNWLYIRPGDIFATVAELGVPDAPVFSHEVSTSCEDGPELVLSGLTRAGSFAVTMDLFAVNVGSVVVRVNAGPPDASHSTIVGEPTGWIVGGCPSIHVALVCVICAFGSGWEEWSSGKWSTICTVLPCSWIRIGNHLFPHPPLHGPAE